MKRIVGQKLAEEKTVSLLGQSQFPVSVEYVAKTLDVNWATARAILLTLLAEGRIRGQKTMKSWIFWTTKEDHVAS